MSWPSDGRPRFVTCEVTGHLSWKKGQRHSGVSAHVLDRATAHRVVRTFRSEDRPGLGTLGQGAARRNAERYAAQLNAEEAEAC